MSKRKRVVIIGGVAGGATTAARLRRVDEDVEIVMLERGPYISYANCGLPYYIGGVITDRSKLLIQTPESFNAMFRVDVRTFSEVTAVNSSEKEVVVKDIRNNEEYNLSYDQLVLSPGARPITPNLPGIDHPNIFTLRNVEDTDKIKGYVDDAAPKSAVVIGAGFIGLEMAENLHNKGIKVTVVEAAPQVLNMLDGEMASLLHQHFKDNSTGLLLNNRVASFQDVDGKVKINLQEGSAIEADFVILSIGVRPDVTLAESAGVKLGETGGIWIDEYFQTSQKDIYALGDSVEFPHAISKRPVITYLAGPANKQGRLLANNLTFGHKRGYKGSIGTAIAKVFDLTAAIAGESDKSLTRAGVKFTSTIINGNSHAGYYPGAQQMTVKISFCPDSGQVYGAQVIGFVGVDKRIDLLSTTIQSGGTIYDLQEIEHAYAPPFNSAKDLVNQIGFNAENIIDGFFTPILPDVVLNRDRGTTQLIDVRSEAEFALGSIDGAINIPVQQLRSRLAEVSKDKEIYLFCAVGMRGYIASRILTQSGVERVSNLSGGIKIYRAATAEQSNTEIIEMRQSNKEEQKSEVSKDVKIVDACGLQCPGPIMRLKSEIDDIQVGEKLKITANDQGFYADVISWCNVTGNSLIERSKEKGNITAIVEKGVVHESGIEVTNKGDNKTIIVFSDDMDKALASFVIANGALSMGKKVTMFFTFWGLNVIKKKDSPKVKKDFMGKMFGMMMPKHSGKLKLSNMNMGGVGSKMMKKRMAQKRVDSLEIMMKQAKLAGVNLIACQMSMDIMGVAEEELLDHVNIGGVANYLEEAEHSNVNLFI